MTKTLFLLRHAKSSWKDPTLGDFDRPLSKRGTKDCEIMSHHLTEEKIQPDLVLCSGARRAVDTLEGVRASLGPKASLMIEDGLYHATTSEMLARLQAVSDDVRALMMVGHNPGMENFADFLADGTMAAFEADMRAKFPTAALATLVAPIETWLAASPGGFRLISFVRPRDVEPH